MDPEPHHGFHSRGYLPHIDRAGLVQHVTMHLGDSLPRHALAAIDREVSVMADDVRAQERRRRVHDLLDAGHGSGMLVDPDISPLIIQALRFGDGSRYRLIAWAVMPNHVHVLIEVGAWPLAKIVQSWKRSTARGIHAMRGTAGAVWHREYFDRYVRDQDHLARVIAYIMDNPVKAGLATTRGTWPWAGDITVEQQSAPKAWADEGPPSIARHAPSDIGSGRAVLGGPVAGESTQSGSGRAVLGGPSRPIPYNEALARIAAVAPVAGAERVPLAQAAGRVLAETVRAGGDQPPFDRATMDGYAFVPDPERTAWTVAGTVLAGQVASPPAPGACWRIMTGAPVPAGCTVVPVEQTDGGRERMTLPVPVPAVRNVAFRGEDARTGAGVAQPGLALDPAAVAALAMAGADTVAVARRPRVRILTSGDEVGAAGPAGIRDTNGPFLAAWCAALGWRARCAPLADDGAAVRAALAQKADLIITTGGVSMGDRDLIPGALRDLGADLVFHGVDIQPGKPVLLARRGRTWIVGLPGNPVSVIATAHLILLPLLARLGWAAPRPWLDLPLTTPAAAKARRLFLPGRLVPGGVAPVAWNGSGDGYAAAHAHGLLDVPANARLAAGERVRFLPYLGHAVGVGVELPR